MYPLPAFVLVLCLYHCTGCTVLVPLVQWFGMASTGNVPILLVFVLVLWLYHCTVCTVLIPLVQCSGMASTGNVPNLPVFVLVLCVYRCTVCTVHVPLVVQWFGVASMGNVPILPVYVLVLWVYHCTVCTVFAPLAQCFGMGNPGDVRILMFGLARCTCSATNTVMMRRSCDCLKSYVVGCLYPTCTGAIARLPACTADREVGRPLWLIYTLLPVMTLHAFILL